MEFPDLGQNCSWSLCKNLDFLPLTCAYCKLIFCKDHFNQDAHECPSFKEAMSSQVDTKSFVCSSEECTTFSPVEMLCPKCQKHFCLVHRYHDCFDIVEDAEAKKLFWRNSEEQFVESLRNANDTINKNINKAIQNPRKQATALKVKVMKLKGKAEGAVSIPSTDRIYFLILLPKGSAKASKPVFISKDWTVGRVIDSASSICNVINKNNESKAPKLRLFKVTDGCQISSDTTVKITDLINKGEVMNGDTLILEYINPEEDLNNFELSNFAQYTNTF